VAGGVFPVNGGVFATSACSTDIERLFSHSGDVCSPDRNSLSGMSLNILTTLNFVYREILGYVDKRTAKSASSCGRFCVLNIKLEIDEPTDMSRLLDEEYPDE
jgi:hypothetical protein